MIINGINIYQLPFILTALKQIDLINVAFLRHVPLSCQQDAACFELHRYYFIF